MHFDFQSKGIQFKFQDIVVWKKDIISFNKDLHASCCGPCMDTLYLVDGIYETRWTDYDKPHSITLLLQHSYCEETWYGMGFHYYT